MAPGPGGSRQERYCSERASGQVVDLATVYVLAIDTATPAVTAGLVELTDTARTLAARQTLGARAHAELLTPQVLDVLAEGRVGFDSLDALVVGTGPGPFTGL